MASAGGNAIDKTSVIGIFILPGHRATISNLNFAGAKMLHLVQDLVGGGYIVNMGGTQSLRTCRRTVP